MLSSEKSFNTQDPTMAELPQIKADLEKVRTILQAIEIRIAYLEHEARGIASWETTERKQQNA